MLQTQTARGSQRISIGALKGAQEGAAAGDKEILKVFEDLLGKHKNPMQTILAGTAKLSMIVRRNVFFKNLMKKNEELIAAGKRPMFTKNEDEALALFGDNYKRIAVLDPAQTLHVGTKARQQVVRKMKAAGQKPKVTAEGASNPFSDAYSPWFSTPGMADALEEVGTKIGEGTHWTALS